MELQRNFNLMRELDARSQLLVSSIEERINTITNPDARSDAPPLTGGALERLRQDCRKALDQADEKVSLATHAHEMVPPAPPPAGEAGRRVTA